MAIIYAVPLDCLAAPTTMNSASYPPGPEQSLIAIDRAIIDRQRIELSVSLSLLTFNFHQKCVASSIKSYC